MIFTRKIAYSSFVKCSLHKLIGHLSGLLCTIHLFGFGWMYNESEDTIFLVLSCSSAPDPGLMNNSYHGEQGAHLISWWYLKNSRAQPGHGTRTVGNR